jgi:hypothetical protein
MGKLSAGACPIRDVLTLNCRDRTNSSFIRGKQTRKLRKEHLSCDEGISGHTKPYESVLFLDRNKIVD